MRTPSAGFCGLLARFSFTTPAAASGVIPKLVPSTAITLGCCTLVPTGLVMSDKLLTNAITPASAHAVVNPYSSGLLIVALGVPGGKGAPVAGPTTRGWASASVAASWPDSLFLAPGNGHHVEYFGVGVGHAELYGLA